MNVRTKTSENAGRKSGHLSKIRTRSASLVGAGLLALPSLIPSSLQAAPIYEETFTNTSVPLNNQPVNYVGWNGYSGASGTDISAVTPSGSTYAGISNVAGNPNSTVGYLSFVNNSTPTTFAAVETGLSLNSPTDISWAMNANASGNSVYLLVQVDGNWYASLNPFTTPAVGNATDFQTSPTVSTTFTTNASAWRNFTLNPGTSMALGSALGSNLSSSVVTGIGFYTTSTGVTRIDTLQVVPEPGAMAMVVMGLMGVTLLRKRFRTSAQ